MSQSVNVEDMGCAGVSLLQEELLKQKSELKRARRRNVRTERRAIRAEKMAVYLEELLREEEEENYRLLGLVRGWALPRHAEWCCGPGEMCCCGHEEMKRDLWESAFCGEDDCCICEIADCERRTADREAGIESQESTPRDAIRAALEILGTGKCTACEACDHQGQKAVGILRAALGEEAGR
jgi:hypothetical protein